jgi:4-amino-4-deoxy-L-arabinose transferase-like glycosyltransferase
VGLALFIRRYAKGHVQSYYLPGIIALSIPEFYLHNGVVSTDTFLTFSITLSMFGFWEALREQSKPYWGYLFFAGMGIGLLAKGPIVGILTLPPIFLWTLITKNIQKALFKLPWIGGILLMLSLSLPWYISAEINSPGFLDYFIVGEHFERYFNSEWKGDKYGFPKQQPLGIVWAFLILFLLPWSIAFVRLLIKKGKDYIQNPWVLFLLFWALWTPLFFTSSKSLIHPYVLPSCIPVALIISHYWSALKNKRVYLGFALGLPVLLFAVQLSGKIKPLYASTTDKYLIEQANPAATIFSLDQKSYSSQFYTAGKIKRINTAYLRQVSETDKAFYLILRNKQWDQLKSPYKNQLKLIDSNSKKGLYQFKAIP